MTNIFYSENKKLRNGWWILIFIGFIALTRPIYKPTKQFLTELGFTDALLEPLAPLLILLVTWLCMLIRKQTLSDAGLHINITWLKEFLIGTVGGVVMICCAIALIYLFTDLTFMVNPQYSFYILSYGLYLFLIGSIMEELLHRGFIFQRLIDGIGIWGAQLLIAAIFAFGHSGNPGMEGITEIISLTDLVLGSLIFGFAYIKTKSLALPIGLHLGWNWAQGSIFGFAVSGYEKPGWFKPIFNNAEQWLTGGEFGPEASVFSLIISTITLYIMYTWKGNNRTTTAA